jgi:tetratricopeptide (TPR) repeat protein
MDERVDWETYIRDSHRRYTAHQLAYTKAHSGMSQADFDALEANIVNIQSAMDHAHQQKQWKAVLEFMGILRGYLNLQGHWREAQRCVVYALEAAEHLQDKRALAYWTFYAGLIQDNLSNYEEAESYYQQSLGLAQIDDNIDIQAKAWRRLGWLAHIQGDLHTADLRYRQAIELHRQADDRQGQARAWRQLGILARDSGDLDRAEGHFRTSLDLVEEEDDGESQRFLASIWLDIGRIALRQNRLDEAYRDLEHALSYAQAVLDRLLLADIHSCLAILAEERGDWQMASEQFTMQLDLAEEVGDRQGSASALIALGTLALQQKNHDQAQVLYEQALKIGDRRDQAAAMAQLGTLAYQQGDYEQATTLLHKALAEFQILDCQQEVAGCHHQLGLVAETRQQWREAGEHYQVSLDLCLQLGLLHDAVASLYQLGRLAQRLGQLDAAQRYYQQALDIGEKVGFSNVSILRRALETLTLGPAE